MESPGYSASMMRVMRDRWECAAVAALKQHHYGQAIAMLIKAHKLNEQLTVARDDKGEGGTVG